MGGSVSRVWQGVKNATISASIAFVVSGFNPVAAGTVFVASYASSVMQQRALKKSRSQFNFSYSAQDRKIIVRSPTTARRIVFGTCKISGPLVSAFSTGTDHEYLHLNICLAGHPLSSIDDVYFNDILATDARFNGFHRIKKHLGSYNQQADTDLVAEVSQVNAAHKGTGTSYLYTRLKWDKTGKAWPSGLPNISAVVKGHPLFDPRGAVAANVTDVTVRTVSGSQYVLYTSSEASFVSGEFVFITGLRAQGLYGYYQIFEYNDRLSQARRLFRLMDASGKIVNTGISASNLQGKIYRTSFSSNPALCILTYCLMPEKLGGLGATEDEIDWSYFISAANICDQDINETSTPYKRYSLNGVIDTEQTPMDILQLMLTSCAGSVVYSNGKIRLFVGAATLSTNTIDETWLRGNLSVSTGTGRANIYNSVTGTYIDPVKFWQEVNFPKVQNATYKTKDGKFELTRDIELPFTTNIRNAQRLAHIALEESRQNITVNLKCNLKALQVNVWDVVSLTIAHLGWTNKKFRIVHWMVGDDGIGIDLTLREYADDIYNWNHQIYGQIQTDIAPNTTLANPFAIGAVQNIQASSGDNTLIRVTHNQVAPRVLVKWDRLSGFINGYEIRYKPVSSDSYQFINALGEQTSVYINNVVEATTYDIGVRGVSSSAKGEWQQITHKVVGKLAIPASPSSFSFETLPNGARRLIWMHHNQPVDFAGYKISYAGGSNAKLQDMQPLYQGLLTLSWYDFNHLAAGEYIFAVQTVDTSNLHSEPKYLTATLSPLVTSNYVIHSQREEDNYTQNILNGFIVNKTILANSVNKVGALGATVSVLPDRIAELGGATANIEYTTNSFDTGRESSFRIDVNAQGLGEKEYQIQLGSQNAGQASGTWQALTNNPVTARFIRLKVIVKGQNPTIDSINWKISAQAKEQSYNDINTATSSLPTFKKIATGHFWVGMDAIKITQSTIISMQNVGPGWSWEIISRSKNMVGNYWGTEFKIYNANKQLADAVVDIYLKGY